MEEKNYQEIKVYELHHKTLLAHGHYTVFLCRGHACNESIFSAPPYKGCGPYTVVEAAIRYDGRKLQQDTKLYRCVDVDDNLNTTAWYLTPQEAAVASESLLRGTDFGMEYGELDIEMVEPMPKEFRVRFELDKDGRLFTRVESHPELNGKVGNGKVFFPDRSFKDCDVGDAIVSVAKEFPTYGFLTGEMVKCPSVELKEALEWSRREYAHHEDLVIIDHPARGRYLAVSTADGLCRLTKDQQTGAVYCDYVADGIVEHDAARYTERRDTFMRFLTEDTWGLEGGVTAITDMFKQSKFLTATFSSMAHPELSAAWEPSGKVYGGKMQQAIDAGIIQPFYLDGTDIEALYLSYQNLIHLLDYSYEDAKQMAAEFGSINAEADEMAKKLKEEGKLTY